MSGLGIKLYTDEDVPVQIAEQLSRQGYDVISCRDAGNIDQSLDDEWQLRFATLQERAILVHNISDFEFWTECGANAVRHTTESFWRPL